MEDEIFVQIRFSKETEVGVFHDAIYYKFDEFNSITDEEINEEKVKRITDWVTSIKNAPPPKEPTKEELQGEALRVEAYLVELKQKIFEKE